MPNYFLGLDSSTQSLKGIVIDTDSGEIVASQSVNFSKDLPEFDCADGVLSNSNPLIKHSDPLMWLAALDKVMSLLGENNREVCSKISGISGSGQQHGSVYLNNTFENVLASLDPQKELPEQLKDTLARKTAPIWMDSSTSSECAEITQTIGERLQTDTGSPAIERFTGPQIRKFYKDSPEEYAATKVIHLVSSFMASVLCGKNAPIDFGDGAGMNLLNLKTLEWDAEIAEATAPGLLDKLPPVKPCDTVAGRLSPYFEKYGFKAGTPVVVWSGDNPCSLIGTGAHAPGTAVISLGTSDTFFAAMDAEKVDPDGHGHVFGNPAGGRMCLICFKNGSLAREKVKDEAGVDWKFFDVTAFEETPPANNGNLMLPYFVPEITPVILEPKVVLSGRESFRVGNGAPAEKIRAIVESQALSMKLHSQWIGDFSTVRVTGGASKSQGLCQVLADVFQAKIEKIAVADSAGLGAAMRAANGVKKISFDELSAKFAAATETIEPLKENAEVYSKGLCGFKELLRENISSNAC